jgi:hypothetical protein
MTTYTLNSAKGDTLAKWGRTAPPPGIHMVYLDGPHEFATLTGRAHTLVQIVCRPGAVVRGLRFKDTKGWLFRNCAFEAAGLVGLDNFTALIDTDEKSSDITFGTKGLGCEFRACADVDALSVPEKLALHHTLVRLRGRRMVVAFSNLHDGRNAVQIMGPGCRVEDSIIRKMTADYVDWSGSNQKINRNKLSEGRHFPEEKLHADFIQGTGGALESPITNIEIDSNEMDVGPVADYIQGCSVFDGRVKGLRVTNNRICCDAPNGIALYGVDDAYVDGNTVCVREGSKTGTWIEIRADKAGVPVRGAVERNNTAPQIKIDAGCRV